MNVSMTWGDITLTLVVGVIGSVFAAYLYGKLPALSDAVVQWLARRSARATAARLQRLGRELEQVESFKTDTRKYYGWMLNTLSHVQMRNTFAIIFVVMGIGAMVTAVVEKRDDLALYANFGFGSGMGIFFLANIMRDRLRKLSDLEDRETELKREIEKLTKQ
jgi:hypothetical protein